MKEEKWAKKFYDIESAEKALKNHYGLRIWDGMADESGRVYYLIGTHISKITDTIEYI